MEALMILPQNYQCLWATFVIGALVSFCLTNPETACGQSPPSTASPRKNEKPTVSGTAPEKSPAGFTAGHGPSPSGPDVRVLPINLPTTLQLVDASNPTIALARERINEAYANLCQAQVLMLPSLQTGPAYLRHDGLLQNSAGLVFPTSK